MLEFTSSAYVFIIHLTLKFVCNMQQNQHLWHHLAMFFRDELLSWSWRRPLGMPMAPHPGGGLSPADFKHKVTTNVEHVIGRIHSIAPQSLSDEVIGQQCITDIDKVDQLMICLTL